ncbi:MAG TPA: choice-of-anchor D domain-containing protein, partial [Candidatus Acidoferrum sp.]
MNSLTLLNVDFQREACKVQRLLERRALLAFLVLASTVILNGCAGVVSAGGPKSSAAPQISIQLTPSSLNFGSTVVGKKVSQTVTVANTGKSTVKIKKANLSSGQFSLSGPAMPLSLAAGQSSSFQVWFDASTAGNATGTLSVQTDNGVSSEQVALAGTATPASPQISVSSGSLNLGSTTVGATSDGTLTLTNTGSTNLIISLLSVSGGPFGISGITTPRTIAAGGSTSFSVLFSPTIVGGDSGSITITSNDPQTPTTIIALTGTATASPVAPSITTQPTNQTVTAGQTATFIVAAGGTAPLSYQWQKNGVNIAGGTSTSYTTPATATSDTGTTFRVVVTNSTGNATSAAATLTVNAAPVAPSITTQPTNQTITAGQTATFTVAAGGTAPLSYQWQKNGVNIAGATSTSYTTPATTTSDSGSAFAVVVSNTTGTVTSAAATLTV